MIKSQMTKITLVRSNKYFSNFFFFKASSGLAGVFLRINLRTKKNKPILAISLMLAGTSTTDWHQLWKETVLLGFSSLSTHPPNQGVVTFCFDK